ncbi:uncharacterized protein LOC143036721 isoform X1 [Oratosquilla oratoria]|uniref:uncharacterized protein LOC143036721 isoform X1 n=1 Tax=Oratosquilla oratoria TaxID=337810 RepID=UPI003F7629F0
MLHRPGVTHFSISVQDRTLIYTLFLTERLRLSLALENAVWPNPDWNKKNIRMKETVRDHKAYTRNPSINITTKYTLVTSSAQDTKLDNHQHRYYLTIEHSAYD